MPFENFSKSSTEKKSELLVSTGIDKNGIVVYESMNTSLPDVFSEIPTEVFNEITADFKSLPETNAPMMFKPKEYLNLAINSDKKVLYEILDAKKGYYFIVKVDTEGAEMLEVLNSKDHRNHPNPFIIVCSESEVKNWLNS